MQRLLLLLFLGSLARSSGCTKKEVPKQTAILPGYGDIRSIDFRNFDYPKIPGEMDHEIHLRNGIQRDLFRDRDPNAEAESPFNGQASLEQVLYNYNDEGQPIAFVILGVSSGGSMMVSEVFLYNLVDHTPKLLWSFESGDRADGGLRAIYFERGSGNLILELYEEGANDPLCCATHFARHFYNWKDDHLVELGKEEWIPLPKQPGRTLAEGRHSELAGTRCLLLVAMRSHLVR
jgi:hypothetical protein